MVLCLHYACFHGPCPPGDAPDDHKYGPCVFMSSVNLRPWIRSVFTADSLTADCELRSIDTGVQNDTCSVDDPSSVFTDPKPFELRNDFDAILVCSCAAVFNFVYVTRWRYHRYVEVENMVKFGGFRPFRIQDMSTNLSGWKSSCKRRVRVHSRKSNLSLISDGHRTPKVQNVVKFAWSCIRVYYD